MNRRLAGPDHSLNAPMRTDGDGDWQDRLVDEGDCHEARLGDQQELRLRRDLLWQTMTQLKGRERDILIERRLKEDPPTLLQLSRKHGTTSERVRQIEARAFEKLRKAILSAAAELGLSLRPVLESLVEWGAHHAKELDEAHRLLPCDAVVRYRTD